MEIKQFEIWLADLNPRIGTEPGRIRPIIIVQSDLLNQIPHPSTLICPITSQVNKSSDILRVHLKKGMAGLNQDCDILIDQLRAIDNRRMVRRIGELPESLFHIMKNNLIIVLDLDKSTPLP